MEVGDEWGPSEVNGTDEESKRDAVEEMELAESPGAQTEQHESVAEPVSTHADAYQNPEEASLANSPSALSDQKPDEESHAAPSGQSASQLDNDDDEEADTAALNEESIVSPISQASVIYLYIYIYIYT